MTRYANFRGKVEHVIYAGAWLALDERGAYSVFVPCGVNLYDTPEECEQLCELDRAPIGKRPRR